MTMTATLDVVVVDDVPELRELLRLGLEELPGVRVVGEAGDGVHALEAVERLRPAAVLLDLSMPRMDGLEAIPLIRALAPRIAIVVVSGFAAERMERQAIDRGADRYLVKGVPLTEIRRAVVECVAARREAA